MKRKRSPGADAPACASGYGRRDNAFRDWRVAPRLLVIFGILIVFGISSSYFGAPAWKILV